MELQLTIIMLLAATLAACAAAAHHSYRHEWVLLQPRTLKTNGTVEMRVDAPVGFNSHKLLADMQESGATMTLPPGTCLWVRRKDIWRITYSSNTKVCHAHSPLA